MITPAVLDTIEARLRHPMLDTDRPWLRQIALALLAEVRGR